MTTISIRCLNRNDHPIFIQVEPWAGIYRLAPGEAIDFSTESEAGPTRVEIDESGDTRYLAFPDSRDYFVVRDGRRVHWSEYPNNGPWPGDFAPGPATQ
jgi:hypothetical protein